MKDRILVLEGFPSREVRKEKRRSQVMVGARHWELLSSVLAVRCFRRHTHMDDSITKTKTSQQDYRTHAPDKDHINKWTAGWDDLLIRLLLLLTHFEKVMCLKILMLSIDIHWEKPSGIRITFFVLFGDLGKSPHPLPLPPSSWIKPAVEVF